MPAYPPPRRFRSDNIARFHGRDVVDGLLRALVPLRGRSGPWHDRDPQALEDWWRAVLNDPRARRSREEHLPADHPDACLRLDRCRALAVTVKCTACDVSAVYTLDDLKASFAPSQNITRLPAYLLPCRDKHARREGDCDLRVEPGGYLENLRTVKAARGSTS
jgi:hypothetical protein